MTAAPWDPSYFHDAGFAAEQEAAATHDRARQKLLLAQAAARYDDTLARQPGNVGFLVDRARAATVFATLVDPRGYHDADARWKRTLARDPHDWELHKLRAQEANGWANQGGGRAARAIARDEFATTVALRPSDYDSWIDLGREQLALGDAPGAIASARRAGRVQPFGRASLQLLADALRAAHRPVPPELQVLLDAPSH